jgi:PBP1b-binding outer membrane lipoprotein LpoB
MKIINYITSLIVLFIGCNGKNHGLSDYTIKIDNLIKHNRIVINIDTLPEEKNYK